MAERRPKVLSLFSGAGGLDAGLEQVGFDHVGCVEIDPIAREALRVNRPKWWQPDTGDVVQFGKVAGPADFGLAPGELDLVAGGPPCQPFSSAAQWAPRGRQGMADVRAQTIHGLLEIVEKFQPKMVLLENVAGFVSGRNAALPTIEKQLRGIQRRTGTGYRSHHRLINAADYGVPQNRKRAIVVLVTEGLEWAWPSPTHEAGPVTAAEAFAGLVQSDSKPTMRGKWAELLPSIPPGQNYQWLTSEGGGDELFGYRTKYWNFLLKLDPAKPSWTLAASPGPSSGPFHWENRPLTIEEAKRLQTIPDEWGLSGSYRDQMKLIGNATPTRLSAIFGNAVRTSLSLKPKAIAFAKSQGSDLSLPIVEPVPKKYRHLIGSKPRHPGHGLGPGSRDNQRRPETGRRPDASLSAAWHDADDGNRPIGV